MVRDRDVLIAQSARGVGHFVDRALAVGGARMHLQVPADVLHLDEVRQTMLLGERDLTARLAQLGRNPVEAQLGVYFLFGLPGHATRSLEQAILVELVPVLLRDLAELDVVRFGAGEVLQGRAVGRGLDGAEVDLQAAPELHRGARLALGYDFPHFAEPDEPVHDPRARVGGYEDVEIADRLAPPAIASGDLDLPDVAARLQVADDRLRLRLGFVQEHAPLGHLRLANAGAHLLFHLGPEALELLHLARVERLRQVGRGFHLELRIQELHALGAEARDAQEIEQAGGEFGRELLAERQLARRDDVADFLGEVLSDTGDLREVFLVPTHEVGNRLRVVPDRARGVAVGPDPEGIRVLDLEEIRDFVEDAGDVGVLHRWSVEDGRRR